MKAEQYHHPALKDLLDVREMVGIVDTIIHKSDFVYIISLTGEQSKDIIFIPRKIYRPNIKLGFSCIITGEDRHKDYYGDFFIAHSVKSVNPSLEIFSLYAAFHFHLLDRTMMNHMINYDREAFLQAVASNDLVYFSQNYKIPRYVARKFLNYCASFLGEK